MTEPSTINPKSMAPKLIKFAETLKIFIKLKVNNKARGMVEATIKPARKLPNNTTRIKMTIKLPSIKFF